MNAAASGIDTCQQSRRESSCNSPHHSFHHNIYSLLLFWISELSVGITVVYTIGSSSTIMVAACMHLSYKEMNEKVGGGIFGESRFNAA